MRPTGKRAIGDARGGMVSLTRVCIAVSLVMLAGCGGGGPGTAAAPPAAPAPVASPSPSPDGTTAPTGGNVTGQHDPTPGIVDLTAVLRQPPAHGDDWTTFAHDQLRSGFQAQPVGFDRTSVATLAPAWRVTLGTPVKSSPLVAGGAVYVATQRGSVVALDAATGAVRWRSELGAEIAMTPSLADGNLIVATHPAPGTIVALDAATGTTRWSRTLPFVLRSEPAIANGIVVMGEAGGDPPACLDGGLIALDEQTGATRWIWAITDVPGGGGSVWSPISWDGARFYAGTGNTCIQNGGTANAVIANAFDGTAAWHAATADPLSDDDIGGGLLVLGSRVVATTKSATLRAFDTTTGAVVATIPLPAADGYGGIGSPSTDGTTLIVSAGASGDPSGGATHGTLMGFDATLTERWRVTTRRSFAGSVAIGGGLGFVVLDGTLVALDPATGSTLWSYALSSTAYASPAIVPSGLYAVDDVGDVYAFRPAATSSAARRRSR